MSKINDDPFMRRTSADLTLISDETPSIDDYAPRPADPVYDEDVDEMEADWATEGYTAGVARTIPSEPDGEAWDDDALSPAAIAIVERAVVEAQALVAVEVALEPVVMLTQRQAEALWSEFGQSARRQREILLELHDKGGMRALGFSTWQQFAREKLHWSENNFQQVLQQARVESNLAGTARAVLIGPNGVSSHVTRHLAKLSPVLQVQAFEEMKMLNPTPQEQGRVDELNVKKIVVRLGGKPPKKEVPHPAEIYAGFTGTDAEPEQSAGYVAQAWGQSDGTGLTEEQEAAVIATYPPQGLPSAQPLAVFDAVSASWDAMGSVLTALFDHPSGVQFAVRVPAHMLEAGGRT